MKEFSIINYKGDQTFIRTPSDYVDATVLAANVGEVMSVPSSGAFVVFSADGDFYAKPNSLAAIPATEVTDGSASEMNPSSWYIVGLTGIGLIASASRKITLSYYAFRRTEV